MPPSVPRHPHERPTGPSRGALPDAQLGRGELQHSGVASPPIRRARSRPAPASAATLSGWGRRSVSGVARAAVTPLIDPRIVDGVAARHRVITFDSKPSARMKATVPRAIPEPSGVKMMPESC